MALTKVNEVSFCDALWFMKFFCEVLRSYNDVVSSLVGMFNTYSHMVSDSLIYLFTSIDCILIRHNDEITELKAKQIKLEQSIADLKKEIYGQSIIDIKKRNMSGRTYFSESTEV